ncbi:MAG: aspartate kinase [Flavobacteriales bacterium]|nr:aspartate kinase [Flavobacteriales bacterium]MDP4716378.1 aspartate kinase [Flavobacteriales bacterium]MDP4731176.1 aspartate kinase [Flavobacteriales bacterium]MDP4818014.1 aspartate kinase [Flavobacteriales bacterium]MDP4950122.1 aspartate kinase [Flavobacteriales bacterium]
MAQVTVHKFGGASVRNAEAVRNVCDILKGFPENKIVIVSAMGKTTNALETIHSKRFEGKNFESELQEIFEFHHNIAKELSVDTDTDWILVFDTLAQICKNDITDSFDEEYDRIIGYGEYLSTAIVNAYFNQNNLSSKRLNSADYVVTDSRFRDARVLWEMSEQRVASLQSEFQSHSTLVLQGFIGASKAPVAPQGRSEGVIQDALQDRSEGASQDLPEDLVKHLSKNLATHLTSLGREGSDFSAAIFAYLLNAESVTIWKDVPGLLNADPKCFMPTQLLKEISFREAVELAYYGASVIHPRTIKPLQNKNIPLYIKSFLNPNAEGTRIVEKANSELEVASYILKQNQTLVSISTKDFSFVVEDNLTFIFNTFANLGVHVHMMENSALNFSVCIPSDKNKLKALIEQLSDFNVRYNDYVSILTIRHPKPMVMQQLLQYKEVLLEQRNRTTVRFVIRGTWNLPEPIKE